MKQEEKMYFQLVELQEKFVKEREKLQVEIAELKKQNSRFISHIDLIEEKANKIPELMDNAAETMVEKLTEVSKDIGQNLVDSLKKQVYENGINALKDLNAEANNVQIQVNRYNKQNRVRNIYIGLAFFVGVSLTVVAIEYFVPRNQYNVYTLDGKVKHVVPVKR